MRASCPLIAALLVLTSSGVAVADGISKEECLAAHGRGQDARDQGKLSLARKWFLSCAQSACPALVQGDCAQLADELSRRQPSVSFVARDQGGNDLPDTAVYVDDVLVATRLDDGSAHEVDPGRHVVRFTHGGREERVTIVLANGEKERLVVATFPGGTRAAQPREESDAPTPRRPARTGPAARAVRHAFGAKVMLAAGGASLATGLAFAIYGFRAVPEACSLTDRRCNGAPGDPVFDEAASAAGWVDTGYVFGAVGAGLLVGGAVWYFSSGHEAESSVALAPWASPGGAGLLIQGHL